jgi:hypothetical protein
MLVSARVADHREDDRFGQEKSGDEQQDTK